MQNLISKEEKDRIDSICEKYNIKGYSINSDGSIDVDGSVLITEKGLITIPLRFNNVIGSFYCNNNSLTSLLGSPKYVGGTFDCGTNRLMSLKFAPDRIQRDFLCENNPLSDLVGGPSYVNGDYFAYSTHIKTLVGCAAIINGNLQVGQNLLLTNTMSGDTDIELKGRLLTSRNCKIPNEIVSCDSDTISLILKYQRHFFIWNDNLTLNIKNLKVLIEEIEDGLE